MCKRNDVKTSWLSFVKHSERSVCAVSHSKKDAGEFDMAVVFWGAKPFLLKFTLQVWYQCEGEEMDCPTVGKTDCAPANWRKDNHKYTDRKLLCFGGHNVG